MNDHDDAPEPKRAPLGPVLARWGLYLVGFAMVVGFVIGVGMNLLDDPEEPAAIYGKLFAAVLVIMTAGIVIAVVGAIMKGMQPKPTGPPPRRKPPQPTVDSDDDADITSSEPPAPTKSWDDAYSNSHRRR